MCATPRHGKVEDAGVLQCDCCVGTQGAQTGSLSCCFLLQVATPGSRYDVGVWRNLQLLRAEGGIRAMYSGFTPTLIRAFPANAAQWLTWELAFRFHTAASANQK